MRIELQALNNPNDTSFSGSMVIQDARFTIGRGESCSWVIKDSRRVVSKHHCTLEQRDDGVYLVDKSTNGVSVGGIAVDRQYGQRLSDGDTIEIADYRFRISIQKAGAVRVQQQHNSADLLSGPSLTSILTDIAPGGVGATSELPGESHDELFNSPAKPVTREALGAVDIGWDGPPVTDVDIIKPYRTSRPSALADRIEQTPTANSLFDLPVVRPILPDNWDSDDDEPTAPTLPELPPVSQVASQHQFTPAPVERPAYAVPPASQPAQHSDARLLAAFLEGAGIETTSPSDLDAEQLMRKAGAALKIAFVELYELHVGKNASAARLELEGIVGETPWIFSLAGQRNDQLMDGIIEFIGEADPSDMKLIERDFQSITNYQTALSAAVLDFIGEVQQAIDPATLSTKAKAKTIPALRKAALWDEFLASSTLFDSQQSGKPKPALMKLLRKFFPQP
ncbi:type VI secretion system-associated FHA domain protein [Phyllobacterium myrsinacearum]|uniref:Type VI secretion system FHA domain protein n=1 Tax=Phyllobacterium myrsinacearum TaxID=28101 RepID=A0A839EQF1_9HYPH|nr:FHA domain-containing protein [Phyllobacterium myrsinacearum]MBA8879734.1 type VI secretion system FHA domain protein [Phyllobacterium myrsinacearum]